MAARMTNAHCCQRSFAETQTGHRDLFQQRVLTFEHNVGHCNNYESNPDQGTSPLSFLANPAKQMAYTSRRYLLEETSEAFAASIPVFVLKMTQHIDSNSLLDNLLNRDVL